MRSWTNDNGMETDNQSFHAIIHIVFICEHITLWHKKMDMLVRQASASLREYYYFKYPGMSIM